MKITTLSLIHSTWGRVINKIMALGGKSDPSYPELYKKFKTPEELNGFMQSTFKYKPDPLGGLFDYASPPAQFLYKKEDDCDTYAWFAYDVLSKMGYDCVMVMMQFKSFKNYHVSCFFKDNDKWRSLDNWGLQEGKDKFTDLFAIYEESNKEKLIGYFVFDGSWKTLECKKVD